MYTEDLISRQAAIESANKIISRDDSGNNDVVKAMTAWKEFIKTLPSVQPEIIRCKDCMHNGRFDTDCPIDWNGKEYCSFAERIQDADSSGNMSGTQKELKHTETHESCTDCPLYDHDRHNCPRFNKVIPTAILDAQQRWIPIKWHDCTDEEREEYGFAEEIVVVFDCEMPNDKQEILVTTSHGYVEQDVCYIDDGYSLDSGYDWIEDIIAWMPRPEPYAERRQDGTRD